HTKRKNKDGSVVSYLQLAHNIRDGKKGAIRAEVLYNFGRSDQLDVDAIRRLIKSLTRFLPPEEHSGATSSLDFVSSKPMGGAYLLRKIWEKIGIKAMPNKSLKEREFSAPVEWAIFAMVANGALSPDSKVGVEQWVKHDVVLGNDAPISLHHLYRAMDYLLEEGENLQKEVFFTTADLLNLSVDLLFFDTASTYVERDEEDIEGLRRYGYSKDSRPDLPQVVIGLAVTKEGIPVRCWVLPGNTPDMKTVELVKKDLRGWRLSRCVWVMDRGMNSEANRMVLQQGGGHYIIGERAGDGSDAHREVLSHGGRFKKVKDNLEVKEVVAGDGERRRRFIVVYNPLEAVRDAEKREETLKRIGENISAIKGKKEKSYKKALCLLTGHRTMGRYVMLDSNGTAAINEAKVKEDEKYDGKYILSTSDDTLSAEDAALGYKQHIEVERAFRTLKTTLELRPMYHRKDDRISSHILLCFLALLLIRVAEKESGMTWDSIRAVMNRLHLGEFHCEDSIVFQTTKITSEQAAIFHSLDVPVPPRFTKIKTPPS
ncbi:MAG: IS1634 family transposase, partial [Nitrospirae bacterium]|nr:IS1634 family transposase [Nitrospirota bacterium]